MALVKPSRAGGVDSSSIDVNTVYTGTTKSFTTDLASIAAGQKRYPEPINRTIATISEWIDGATVSGGSAVNLAVASGNLPAATIEAFKSTILQAVYPVGCLYESTVATNPATIFGFGTWVAYGEGRFLLGADGTYTAGTTGGSADAVVVSHNHTVAYNPTGDGTQNQSATFLKWGGVDVGNLSLTASTEGVSGTGKNMPPYVVVYRWTRTA